MNNELIQEVKIMTETIKKTMEAKSLFKNNSVFDKHYTKNIDTYGEDVVTIGSFDIVGTKESEGKYYFDVYHSSINGVFAMDGEIIEIKKINDSHGKYKLTNYDGETIQSVKISERDLNRLFGNLSELDRQKQKEDYNNND